MGPGVPREGEGGLGNTPDIWQAGVGSYLEKNGKSDSHGIHSEHVELDEKTRLPLICVFFTVWLLRFYLFLAQYGDYYLATCIIWQIIIKNGNELNKTYLVIALGP